MWDTIKVIIGLLLMVVIGIVIFIGKVLLAPINPAEVAQGLPAFPVIGIVVFVVCIFMEMGEK
ncbi:MAG: hypothetical protein SPL22_08285 [Treponema sp.]|uniref:hypothetical protein n=1 Tax=Treponema sp. TaxID=166 RepID=UPI002A91CD0E|nr:hypothetical protein [Treponema sp.]MDY6397717.1 hypothetical protein [Treponema sp.]